jgi:hypothetical protein
VSGARVGRGGGHAFEDQRAEWSAAAYGAWLDQTDGQGDLAAWLVDHPEPPATAEHACE